MKHAELRARLHDVLGPGQPPADLASRALSRIDDRRRAPHAWVVGASIAAILFVAVIASTYAVRTMHSSPRMAQASPSAPVFVGGQPSGSPAVGLATPGASASPQPNGAVPSASASVIRFCTGADLDLSTSTAGRYPLGQTVQLTSTARNISSTACVVRAWCWSHIEVDNSSGTDMHAGEAGVRYDCGIPEGETLAPGAWASLSLGWDQRQGCTSLPCNGPPVPPGTYSARGVWDFVSTCAPGARGCSSIDTYDARAVSFTIDPAPQCSSSDVGINASTDHSSYGVGGGVTITGTITDHASHPCWFDHGGRTVDFSVTGANGTVWDWCSSGMDACFTASTGETLYPGQSASFTATWNQQQCNSSNVCTQVAPGTYRATVTFATLGSASATFTIGAT